MNEPVLTEITLEDIESLAVGAWILGTGGGGSPYLGLLNLRRLYAEGYRVQLMSPLDLEDDDRVAVVSNMGAPLIGQERLADSRNIARAVEMQEEFGGFKFRAVMSVEIGGGNGTQALMAAAHLNIPVVDADCMGRAFPEAQMTSVAIGGLRPYPCTLYDPRGIEAIVTKVPSWKWMERASRKICVEMGSIASTSKAPRSGREVKDWGIHFTTTAAIRIGRLVREANRLHTDPIAALLESEGGKRLFTGKVVDVARRTTEGFRAARSRSRASMTTAARAGLSFQNEWIVAWREGGHGDVARLICVLESVSGTRSAPDSAPMASASRGGAARSRRPDQPARPRICGPPRLGYDLDFRSVFKERAGAGV
jgi:DUF917 family protein